MIESSSRGSFLPFLDHLGPDLPIALSPALVHPLQNVQPPFDLLNLPRSLFLWEGRKQETRVVDEGVERPLGLGLKVEQLL